jgi:hypothetical protein
MIAGSLSIYELRQRARADYGRPRYRWHPMREAVSGPIRVCSPNFHVHVPGAYLCSCSRCIFMFMFQVHIYVHVSGAYLCSCFICFVIERPDLPVVCCHVPWPLYPPFKINANKTFFSWRPLRAPAHKEISIIYKGWGGGARPPYRGAHPPIPF